MTREQEIYNNIWNEIDKRISIPKITREQLKAKISDILSIVTVVRYEFSGNDDDSLKLCAIFVVKKNSDKGQPFYDDFYEQLKDWYISEFAKINPAFTQAERLKNVFVNYMKDYLCGFLNDEIFTLNHFFSLSEWNSIFFGNKKEQAETYEYQNEEKIVKVNYI
jgi:bifunctional DNA-binding transcriptional regulator/antitoxin component of YhaV-PrlF toxin-antitoxin module